MFGLWSSTLLIIAGAIVVGIHLGSPGRPHRAQCAHPYVRWLQL